MNRRTTLPLTLARPMAWESSTSMSFRSALISNTLALLSSVRPGCRPFLKHQTEALTHVEEPPEAEMFWTAELAGD